MFFKSCNCNSSIATRIGFAVSIAAVTFCIAPAEPSVPDHFLPQLYSGLVDEDRYYDKADSEMEF